MNLLSNAKDAISSNDGAKVITLYIEESGDQVIFKVKDNGCGLSSEIQQKIFDPFFTTKDVNEGTGIGLSLVHNFIKELGGEISVQSKIGSGTTFSLKLPFKSQQMFTLAEEKENLEQVSLSGNVMLIDDEEGIRDLLSDYLETMGLNVDCFENGKEALECLEQCPNKYDLIVSDMQMPVMDGPTLLKQIRSHEVIKQPYFIFVTGGINVDLEDKNNELYPLIDGHLMKPFEYDAIYEDLYKVLSAKVDKKVA